MSSEIMKGVYNKIKWKNLSAVGMTTKHQVVVLRNAMCIVGLMAKEDGDAVGGHIRDLAALCPGIRYVLGVWFVIVRRFRGRFVEHVGEPAGRIVGTYEPEPWMDFGECVLDALPKQSDFRLLMGVLGVAPPGIAIMVAKDCVFAVGDIPAFDMLELFFDVAVVRSVEEVSRMQNEVGLFAGEHLVHGGHDGGVFPLCKMQITY